MQYLMKLEAALSQYQSGGDPTILISENFTELLEQAKRGYMPTGPLAGVTAVIKDIIDVAGLPTTRGSAFAFEPAEKDAALVTRLREAGVLIIGKANLHEFAWGVTNQNPHWGTPMNPRYPLHTTGGSSGGSAAAIAAGITQISIGTDTAGSIRIPAAACGITGLRPRTGQLPTEGVFGLAEYADVSGPMAASVAETVKAWNVISGSAPEEYWELDDLDGRIVGVVEETPLAHEFERRGAVLVDLDFPQGLLDSFWQVFWFQAFSVHRENFETAPEKYGHSVRAKLSVASAVTPDDYQRALGGLAEHRRKFAVDSSNCDFFISETLGSPLPLRDADELAVRQRLGRLTAPVSALDLAAFAIGNLQIFGRDENTVIRAALLWEQQVGRIPEPELAPLNH